MGRSREGCCDVADGMPCAFVRVSRAWRLKTMKQGAPGAVVWARDRGSKTRPSDVEGGGDLQDHTDLPNPIF